MKAFSRSEIFLIVFLSSLTVVACRQDAERGRVPSEVQEVITTVGDNITQERYEQVYSESSELWKKDVTLEQSNEVFKTLRTKLGKVESRTLHSASEQQNSGGTLKGHVYILGYQTRFERGDGMETFTLIEENGRWRLARYFVNSTALQ
jgi:basic membrane lipoprotein Med (substrate-binding protein (PBP1-ABC) superfamily)